MAWRLRLAKVVQRALRKRRAGDRDFKRFLREAPDFELLELTRQDDAARQP